MHTGFAFYAFTTKIMLFACIVCTYGFISSEMNAHMVLAVVSEFRVCFIDL